MLLHELERAVLNRHRERERLVVVDVDLPAAIAGKLAKNARKYPASLVRGSSKKYTEYSAEAAAAAADADEAAAAACEK